MKQVQTRENRPGVRAWICVGRYQVERYMYTLHRVTGLGLILSGIIYFIITTVFLIKGQGVREAGILLFNNSWFKTGVYLASVAFIFHAVNGSRLILQELGIALGKPTRPTYPFTHTGRKNRPWTMGMLAAIIILALFLLYNLVLGGR